MNFKLNSSSVLLALGAGILVSCFGVLWVNSAVAGVQQGTVEPFLQVNPLTQATSAGYGQTGRVIDVINSKQVIAQFSRPSVVVGDRLILRSQEEGVGVIAYFVVTEVFPKDVSGGQFLDSIEGSAKSDKITFKADLLRMSGNHLVRQGDLMIPADLSFENELYGGKTELMDPDETVGFVSNRYRSLYTQGLGIGETAETLRRDELLLAWYGYLAYGAKDWLTISSYLPFSALGAPNCQVKARFYNSLENKLAMGVNFFKVPNSTENVFNLSFMWDSFSSSSMISHSYLTLAVVTYDNSKETTAVKSLGSSAIQSGYEFLLPNWSRVLVGPNYNFETKSLGGYVSYLKIWEHFHFQLTLASNNLSAVRLDVKDGYYGIIDAYWRY
jgi:hypothetical protein